MDRRKTQSQRKKKTAWVRKKRPWGVVGLVAIGVGTASGGYLLWRAPNPAVRSALADELTPGCAVGFNVLVITLDTTRADHIGCYGYRGAQTPVIDGLAAQGVRFADAVANVPMTLPSHAAIFTGLYPPNHGVRTNAEYRLDASYVTLAEVLRDHGYQTAAFVSAFVLDARYGLDQGFEIYDATVDTASAETIERFATAVTTAATRWLVQRNLERPFFLWVHYFDPHFPYEPPQPFAERFRNKPYDGEIAYVDTQMGRLLQALTQASLRERTLIVVVGDHGESLGEHNEGGHGRLIYDAAMRVPLIVVLPGLLRGPYVVDDVVVAVLDVFPTVLELVGVPTDVPLDGISLLHAETHTDRAVYLETMATYLKNGGHHSSVFAGTRTSISWRPSPSTTT